ncbi:Uncharacterised protein [Yersinia frederiksenii]|uniref:hypothetical protein n=1 Tax=Yersinia enterocolitica TaxID=630 RepID=UPI0005E4B4DC|nr:Uncharacterised protein [Yersinia frederiksenii]CNI50456.1 Uncharacterised protein [Yersinia frederiksenii]HDL7738191.1 hypothetical protein [Yersinia enterocolitica]HEN3374087.1 hypothetical protein [Yersinia enterocolitica]
MAWQGIPFIPEHIISNSYLAISKIPKIIIDSEFSWESSLITILGSLIAGAIPAIIAWKAIDNSNKLLRSQMELAQTAERINKIRDFSAQYTAEVEILGASMLAKRRLLDESGSAYDRQDLAEGFEAAKKLNVSINSIILLINTDLPEAEIIEMNLKACNAILQEAFSKEIPMNAVQLPGIKDFLDKFLVDMRHYLNAEIKIIRNS